MLNIWGHVTLKCSGLLMDDVDSIAVIRQGKPGATGPAANNIGGSDGGTDAKASKGLFGKFRKAR